MNEKYLKLNKQFENAVSQICQSPDEFNALLRVAAFNYRLTFQNAVLAYAQGTDSDLLLTYEQWQLYGRVAKRHTKATLLFDVNKRNRYVVTFPMSRTVVDKRIHNHKELRFFDYRNDAAVVAALQAIYQTDADNLTEILYAENRQRFESFFDDAYPAFDNEPDFLAKAVTNMLMCRFGEEMPYKSFSFSDGINRDNIEHIYQMVIDVFRAEYAEIVTSLPAELEKAREFTEDDDLSFDDVPVSTDSVTEIKQDVISLFKEKTNGLFHSIDGLSPSEIEQMVNEYAESVFSENEISAEILRIAISGSRCRGLEHNGSDLDVVIEVQSDTKETALFNLLNERTFEIGGVRVDINPIKADETGTLSEYLPTVEKYLGKIEILDYGKYIIDNRSVFNAKKGSIYTIPIETTPALLRRLEKVGVVPRDEMTDVVFESDNGTWNKLIIPDRYGNKTNSIDISDVLSQEEISAAKKVVADVIEREQSRNETHRSLTKDDVQLLHTIEPRKSVLNFSQDELTLTSVWSERFAAEIGKKSPFYRAENGEWRDHDESKSQIITVEAVETDFKSVRNDIKAQKIKRGITVNEDTHWSIQISRKGLEDSVKYGFTHKNGNIYNLLYAIQNIVANSVLLDSNISEKNNNNKAYNTAFMHKFYTVCRIGDQPVLAKLSVEEFLDGKGSTLKRMYNLQDIKTEPLRHIEFTDNQLARSVLNGSEISVADLFRIVKALDKDFYLNKQPHDQAKVFQVITNAGDDGGYDEKPEYATLDEAIQAGDQYIADGYIGFSVFNTDTKHIEYTDGDFNITKVYSDDVLQINNIPVSPVVPVDNFDAENAALTVFDEKAEERKYPFFGVSEVVNRIFATTPRLHASLEEIGTFYNAVSDEAKREDYIRSIFNNDSTELSLSDGTHVGYKTYENGLLIWKGSYDSREGQNFLHWDDVAGHFEAMRMLEMLPSTSTTSNQNGQLLLFPEITKKQNEKFSFPQEVIDRVLTLSGGERKLRIYEQFEKAQSSKENMAFLRNVYGWGGCSEVIRYTGIAEDYNAKGITLGIGYKETAPRQTLKWNEVEKRIKALIKSERFLTREEREKYPSWLEEQERRRAKIKAERELKGAIYQPSEPIEILPSSELEHYEPPKPQYTPMMQEYFTVKNENPDKIILFQIGAFYEAMGNDAKVVSDALELVITKRRLTDDESIDMCGFPENRLETNLNMLLDRGLSVGISSIDENRNRIFVLMDSQKAAPIQSRPVARLDYYRNGKVEQSFEYLDAEQLKKHILEDINRPSPMGLVVYADESGNTIDHSFVRDLPKPLVSVEVKPLPPIQSEHDILMNRAQELIGEYMNAEFGNDDKPYELPEDLSSVNLAFTTTEDEQHEITADANLIDFRIETKIDEKVVRVEQYDSLQDMVENGLDGIRFDDLVYVSDEELIPFYTAVDTADNAVADTNSLSDKPTEKKISLPSEKPVVQLTQQDIDSLLILKPTVQNGKAEIYHAFQEEKPDSELIRLIREKYHGSGRNARSASGLLLQISDNSKGIFVAAYGNAYQPIIITYTQLLKRIRELAATNRYLTDSEFVDYAENYHLGDKAAVLKQLKFKYEIGSAVNISGQPYMITAMSPVSVVVAQPDAPLFGHTYSLEDFEALLLQNIDDNLSLVDKPETRYEIYQVADTEQAHKYIFLSLKSLEKSGLAVERKNYQLVYSGTLGEGENLDTLFERFNINHPDDFSGHSMSVSDVVVLTKYGESKAYFCDDVGFPEVPSFLSQEQLQEYILLHPEERAVSWIYYNPDGNQGSGQIVHETISADELASSIDSLSRDGLSEFFANNGAQRLQDIETPTQYTLEYSEYVDEQPNGMQLLWNPQMSDEDFESFKDKIKEFQKASRVMRQPQIVINFSEHPALSDIVRDKARLRFSFANELLGRLDMLENAKRENPNVGFYYKTDFTVYASEDGLSLSSFNGRYDLADGETNLIGHIERVRDYDDSSKAPIYNEWLVMLQDSLERNPLTENEKAEIERIVTQDYGLDKTEDVELPKAPDNSDLVDKTVDYADKTFRVKSVNQFGQAHLEDISSLSDGFIPIDTVLPVETVRELIEAQTEKNPENFVITDNHIGAGTPSERFNNNIAAIKVVQQLQAEERSASKAEQEILSRYVGWGGLPQYFDKSNPHYDELKKLLPESDYQSAYDSTLTSFYTPPVVIKSIYSALTNMGFTNGRILDPACGTGHFFGVLPEHLAQSELFGVELDNISGQIAKALYPNANIKIQGFENTNIPNNSIDVAVGNVPFGDVRVFDKGYNKHHLLIHDYFFAKTLDKVRPGGIIAFVTSKGTLDKQDTKARMLLADKAELLGAIRLPNDTFKSAAGTEVTSDIIFLQKRESAEIIKDYPDWVYTSENSDGIRMNNYFVAHPEMVCGKMIMQSGRFGDESACVPSEDIKLSNALKAAIKNVQGEYIPYTAANEENAEPESIAADEAARNYSYFVKDDRLYYRENGIMFISSYEGKKAERIRGMVKITDITRRLIDAEVSGESDNVVTELRRELNTEYDSFSAQFGCLNSFANRVFKDDNSYPLLCSLENVIVNEETEEKSYVKADIFSKRTIAPNVEINSAENAEEALIISVSQKGRVDLDYMAKLTGNSTEQLINELNGSSIFLKPYEGEYVTADEYLSGNVRKKLTTARMAAKEDESYAVNVKALEAVIPKDIPASGISVRLGTTWIPVHYYNEFLQEIFHPQSPSIEVQYNSMMGSYYITHKVFDNYSIESINQYGIKERNGYTILEDCLNLKTSEVRETVIIDGKERSVINKEKTVLAQSRQELLKAKFSEWIYRDPARRRDLERIYNDNFNCIVPRRYDGTHLTFPGKNPNITFRPHQLNAIARGLYGGNALLAHCVGAGKSFEMIAIAMKLKELGLAHKSLICVPKHLVAQMGAEFMRLYPAANILVAEEKDFTPQNRKRFCTRIATGDYDAIIIGHTQLEKTPLKPETRIVMLNRQRDEILNALEDAKADGLADATVKSLALNRKRIESKLKELNERSLKKDDVICFEELGVDQILIDEAHAFKNLYIYTKMSNVAGIGAGGESGRASDLYGKICYLNELNPGRGVVFATGTPISNTMSEMYTMQRYLQPQLLQSMGLMNFDSWATTFGETVTALEISPEGNSYQTKTRFAKFNNIPELMAMFQEVADVQTRDTLQLPLPDVKRQIIEVPPTEQQKKMIEQLGERAEVIRSGGADPREDNILKIISDGKAIALDPRILCTENNSGMKVAACAEKVFSIWSESEDKTQLVFCDLSTPSVGKSKTKDFTVYEDLKAKLVYLGIPENEVQFIQHYKSSKAKQKLFSEVRRGKVRVLIGSTEMMGTGMNVQHKLIALHHLDCPNRPADIEQREGRIIRQGNTNETVQIYNYVTKGTFDAFMYQMVERKQRFISSVMTANHFNERSVEDIDEATLNFGQIKAVASDNPLVMKKFEIDGKVSKLTAIRNEYINEHRRMEDEVQLLLPNTIKKLESLSASYKEDMEFAKSNPTPDPFDIEICGVHYDKRTKALEAIVAQRNRIKDNALLEIGTYRGFKLYLYQEGVGTLSNLCMTVKHQLGYRAKIEPDNGAGNLVRLDNVISFKIIEKYNDTVDDLSRATHRMATAQEEMNREFPQEAEYQSLLEQQAEINAKLTVGEDKQNDGKAEDNNISKDSSPDGNPPQQLPPNRPKIRR